MPGRHTPPPPRPTAYACTPGRGFGYCQKTTPTPAPHHLLIRRNDATGGHAYLRCYSPHPVPLRTLVAVAGQRWRIEESFQAAKGTRRARSTPSPALDLLAPLDHPGHARPRLPGRGHRHRTRHRTHPDRVDCIDCQRVSASLRRTAPDRNTHPDKPAGLVTMATTTPIPSTPFPLPTSRTPMIPIYGCSTCPAMKIYSAAGAGAGPGPTAC